MVCTEIFNEHHVIMVKIGDVKERGQKRFIAVLFINFTAVLCNETYKAIPHHSRFRGKLLL